MARRHVFAGCAAHKIQPAAGAGGTMKRTRPGRVIKRRAGTRQRRRRHRGGCEVNEAREKIAWRHPADRVDAINFPRIRSSFPIGNFA